MCLGSKNKNTNFFIYPKRIINITQTNSIQDFFFVYKIVYF